MASLRNGLVTLAAVLLAGVLLVAGCSSSGSGDDAELSAEEVMVGAAAAMSEVTSAAFTIEQTGASIPIDDAGQLGFQAADGRFAAPASAEALITVDALGFTTEVGAVAIDGTLWFTNPLSGEWTEAPDSFTFDPATVFDAESGFPALLREEAAGAEFVSGGEEPEDGDRHHLRTSVAAERVSVLTGGLVTSETDVDLWIDRETERLSEVRFELALEQGVSSWQMTIDDYGADVTIEPPEVGSAGG